MDSKFIRWLERLVVRKQLLEQRMFGQFFYGMFQCKQHLSVRYGDTFL